MGGNGMMNSRLTWEETARDLKINLDMAIHERNYFKKQSKQIKEDYNTLRTRLKEIEFGKHQDGCPVCGHLKHLKDCWLAEAIKAD